jgi:plasmid stabilization system protein ParE
MKYRIEISSVAEAEADSACLQLSQVTSPKRAGQWYAGLLQAIESLSQMPKRCSISRENERFSQEIRQLMYGKGRNSYRILFTVLEVQEVPTVRILHIRHAAQQTLGESPEKPKINWLIISIHNDYQLFESQSGVEKLEPLSFTLALLPVLTANAVKIKILPIRQAPLPPVVLAETMYFLHPDDPTETANVLEPLGEAEIGSIQSGFQ